MLWSSPIRELHVVIYVIRVLDYHQADYQIKNWNFELELFKTYHFHSEIFFYKIQNLNEYNFHQFFKSIMMPICEMSYFERLMKLLRMTYCVTVR